MDQKFDFSLLEWPRVAAFAKYPIVQLHLYIHAKSYLEKNIVTKYTYSCSDARLPPSLNTKTAPTAAETEPHTHASIAVSFGSDLSCRAHLPPCLSAPVSRTALLLAMVKAMAKQLDDAGAELVHVPQAQACEPARKVRGGRRHYSASSAKLAAALVANDIVKAEAIVEAVVDDPEDSSRFFITFLAVLAGSLFTFGAVLGSLCGHRKAQPGPKTKEVPTQTEPEAEPETTSVGTETSPLSWILPPVPGPALPPAPVPKPAPPPAPPAAPPPSNLMAQPMTIYICPYGRRYHKRQCQYARTGTPYNACTVCF